MKFLVVLALFAAAAAEPEAEADPWYYYTHGAAAVYHPYTYGYGYPYYQYAVPAVKAAEKVEEVVEAKAEEVKKPVVYHLSVAFVIPVVVVVLPKVYVKVVTVRHHL